MSQIDDWILRYGILLGKRFSDKERVKFLRAAQREFVEMGYQVDTTSSDVSFAGIKQKFYNLYAGDLKNARVLLVSYYDTPAKTFGLYKESAFQSNVSRFGIFVNFMPSFIIFMLSFAVIYFALIPRMNNNYMIVLTIILALLAVFLVSRYRGGLPRRQNLVRNTSSILALLQFASQLKSREAVAFALVDGGTNSGYGLEMAKKYFRRNKKKIIFLDSVANPGELIYFSDEKQALPRMREIPPAWKDVGDVLITSGDYQKGQVLLQKAKDLDEARIQEVADMLAVLVKQLKA